jgi:hypothetical protein
MAANAKSTEKQREITMSYQESTRSYGVGPHDEESEIQALRHRIQDLQDEVQHADKRLREVVRERPLVAIIGAVAAGFFLGRVIGRA